MITRILSAAAIAACVVGTFPAFAAEQLTDEQIDTVTGGLSSLGTGPSIPTAHRLGAGTGVTALCK